ncbi:MAG: LPS biosynthesis glycosyltransferase [Elainella sp.]
MFAQPASDSAVPLIQAIGQTLIVAYREDTTKLEAALTQTGLACEVLRQIDRPEYQGYSSSYRCLLNHHRAWLRATQASQPTLIVEADFVPVMNLGQLPLPFRLNQTDVGLAWLYTCAPQLYSVTPDGFGEGYSTGLVAYIVTPAAAAALCQLVTEIAETSYTTFDSEIDKFLRRQGLKNYIPFRNYGEHGGIPNPEHRRNGLSGIHRADVLWGQLAFLPPYATAVQQPRLALIQGRLQARTRGLGRLLAGKFLRPKVAKTSKRPLLLLRFALLRQLSGVL